MSDVQALTMSQRNSFLTISFYIKAYLVTNDLYNSRQNFPFVLMDSYSMFSKSSPYSKRSKKEVARQ